MGDGAGGISSSSSRGACCLAGLRLMVVVDGSVAGQSKLCICHFISQQMSNTVISQILNFKYYLHLAILQSPSHILRHLRIQRSLLLGRRVPKVRHQPAQNNHKRNKVQPVRPVVLNPMSISVHPRLTTHIEPKPKQQPVKVARQQAQVVVHRRCSPVDQRRSRVQDKHRCNQLARSADPFHPPIVYANSNPTRSRQHTPTILYTHLLTLPLQFAILIASCSSPLAWIPLIIIPYIPSCPTTSYNGRLRTKNSCSKISSTQPSPVVLTSVAFVNPYNVAPASINRSPLTIDDAVVRPLLVKWSDATQISLHPHSTHSTHQQASPSPQHRSRCPIRHVQRSTPLKANRKNSKFQREIKYERANASLEGCSQSAVSSGTWDACKAMQKTHTQESPSCKRPNQYTPSRRLVDLRIEQHAG